MIIINNKIAKGFYFLFVYQRHQCSKLRPLLFSEKLLNSESLILGNSTEQSCAVTFILLPSGGNSHYKFSSIIISQHFRVFHLAVLLTALNFHILHKYQIQQAAQIVARSFVRLFSFDIVIIIILYSHWSASSCKQNHMQRITMDSEQTETW